MDIRIAQLAVQRDLADNVPRILRVLDQSRPGEVVVFPEGALSGYEPQDDGYLDKLDAAAIEDAIREVDRRVGAVECRCLLGSATRDRGEWWNSVLWLDGSSEPRRYHKAELSYLDRRHFSPGPIAGEVVQADGAVIGVLACRELLFPAAWIQLRSRGARAVFHLNNAIQSQDAVWSHLVIARAVEQGIFVCSVNNGAAPQRLPSMLVAPSGRILLQTDVGIDQVLTTRVDLDEVIGDLRTRTDY
jgi:omega-amidase